MKYITRAMFAAMLLVAGGLCAMADTITWTLNDVTFTDGNTATGWFVTDLGLTTIENFSFVVSGPDTATDFTATQMESSYLPNIIGAANSDYSKFTDLYPATSLTSAGGTIDLATGFDCPLCGVLVTSDNPEVTGVITSATPEPSAVSFAGVALVGLAIALRRKVRSSRAAVLSRTR